VAFVPALLILFLGCSRPAAIQSGSTSSAPSASWDPVFSTLAHGEFRPAADSKALALIFILPDCPIANSFLPEINRLHESFFSQGVQFLLVHADSDVSADKAKNHAREYQIQPPVILDPAHDWVKKAGATISPEAVVFSPQGQIVYRGRINDQYIALGKRRGAVTSHDLRDALTAILANQPIPQPKTEPIGCPIPSLPTEKPQ
jgi:hypothetical protein